jgi:hypothetical protein
LTVDTSGAQQFVVFTAPSGGWAVQLDRTRRELFSVEAFITARRPNPAFVHTQSLVEHRVATGVPSTTPLTVYLRLLPHGQEDGEPYIPVTAGNVNPAPVPVGPR